MVFLHTKDWIPCFPGQQAEDSSREPAEFLGLLKVISYFWPFKWPLMGPCEAAVQVKLTHDGELLPQRGKLEVVLKELAENPSGSACFFCVNMFIYYSLFFKEPAQHISKLFFFGALAEDVCL